MIFKCFIKDDFQVRFFSTTSRRLEETGKALRLDLVVVYSGPPPLVPVTTPRRGVAWLAFRVREKTG